MEPVSLDYIGAAASYTPFVVAVCQAIKQSPRVDNRKLPYYAIIIGIVVALAMVIAAGKILWTPSGFIVDPLACLKAILEGTVGGAGGPAVYQIQRQLPLTPLPPGPDNFGAKPTPVVPTPVPTPTQNSN